MTVGQESKLELPTDIRKTIGIPVVVFFVVLIVGILLTHLSQSFFKTEQRLLMRELINSQASAIERRLSRSLSATFILAQEVRRSQGFFYDFETYADEVMVSIGGISNLQLAPDGIIQQVHPLKGNKKAIGHNILVDDKRRKEALAAVRERRMTLAGPFELIQGGIAVIGRNPVFLKKAEGDVFWGFTSALIYLDELLSVTDLKQLAERGYSYQLGRLHPDTGEENVFASHGSLAEIEFQSMDISVPNGQWFLRLGRPFSGEAAVFWLGYILSLTIAALLAFLVGRVLQEPARLHKKVVQQTQELEVMAYHDFLTGLANRRLFIETIQHELTNMVRRKEQTALLYLDLDDFKRINDSLGHDLGDKLLVEVAKRLKSKVRSNDLVARLGGDEFAILLPNVAGGKGVLSVAEMLMHSVSQPLMIDGHEIIINTSIGITLAPVDGDDANQLLRNADMALYASKEGGKNLFSFFNKQMQKTAMERVALEADMRSALREEQFKIAYQPIVNIKTGKVIGREALLRWLHPEDGLIMPDRFIPIAEQSGLIIEMGYWVIRDCCEQMAANLSRGIVLTPTSINLSVMQFQDPSFTDVITGILEETGISPSLITLEVTESLLMDDIEYAVERLTKLKQLGIMLAIDDFGTGYSSLAQLKALPVDSLKVDRCFIKDMIEDGDDRLLTQAIIAFAKKMGLSVVAEGVETEEQLALLHDWGCCKGQGYLFGRPAFEDEV